MDLKLRGKRALVTGSSSGIGVGIAQTLAQEGAEAIVHGRNRERTHAVADELRRSGATATAIVGDLSTDAGATAVADAVLNQIGGVDILVNNAGGTNPEGNTAWMETRPEVWLDTYTRNVGAAVRLCHRLVPGMKERGWGRIINISSGAGMQPNAFIPDYSASKAAISNLTVGLSKALTGTGITVNTVSPGAILTPALETWMRDLARQMGWGQDWATIEKRYTTEFFPLPVPRIGRVEDVATIVAMLASPLASYVTGASFRIDGGHAAAIN